METFSSSTEICASFATPEAPTRLMPQLQAQTLSRPLTNPRKRLNRRKKNLLSQEINALENHERSSLDEQVLEFHNRRGYR